MSENNYGNPQGNSAQNPYAAQQPASSTQGDGAYGQYGQYGLDSDAQQNQYGQYGQADQSAVPQTPQYGQYGQYGQSPTAQPQQASYGYAQSSSYPQQGQAADYNNFQQGYQQPVQDQYGYGQQGIYPYAPVPKKAPVLAIASMILGIIGVLGGLFVLGGLAALIAIILGILALKPAKANGSGMGFAVTGIVTGAVGLLISICMLIVFISVFQTTQKCLEVGTEDSHGNVVCQIGDNPNNRMTISANNR